VADCNVTGRLQRAVDREDHPSGLAAHHVDLNRVLNDCRRTRQAEHQTVVPRIVDFVLQQRFFVAVIIAATVVVVVARQRVRLGPKVATVGVPRVCQRRCRR